MQKQIIINGVDVSGCVFKSISSACAIGCWQKDYEGLALKCRMFALCTENPNCYYKQLQRLKSEHKDLTGDIEKLQEDLTELKQTYEACEIEYKSLNNRHKDLLNKYNELKEAKNDAERN